MSGTENETLTAAPLWVPKKPKSRVRFTGMEPMVYLQFTTPRPHWWFRVWQRWILGLKWEVMP